MTKPIVILIGSVTDALGFLPHNRTSTEVKNPNLSTVKSTVFGDGYVIEHYLSVCKYQDFVRSLPKYKLEEAPIVTLTTDFGLSQPYVAILKAVVIMRRRKPLYEGQDTSPVKIMDITHDVPSGDITAAAFYLKHSYRYFPAFTVHLCIVDPGVGTKRRCLVCCHRNQFFLAPDNGLIPLLLKGESLDSKYPTVVRYLDNRLAQLREVSGTFHGRDIFAPAAAWLSSKAPCDSNEVEFDIMMFSPLCNAADHPGFMNLGPILDMDELAQPPLPKVKHSVVESQIDVLRGRVACVDKFGNVITGKYYFNSSKDIPSSLLRLNARYRVEVLFCQNEVIVPVVLRSISSYNCYAESDGFLLVRNSFDTVELAYKNGSAFSRLCSICSCREKVIEYVNAPFHARLISEL